MPGATMKEAFAVVALMLGTDPAGAVLRGSPVPTAGTSNMALQPVAAGNVTPAVAAVKHNVSAVATVAPKKEHENAKVAAVKHNVSAVATVAPKKEHENAKAAPATHNTSTVVTPAPKKDHENVKAAAVKHNVSAVATVAAKKTQEATVAAKKAKENAKELWRETFGERKGVEEAPAKHNISAVATSAPTKDHENAKVVAPKHNTSSVAFRASKKENTDAQKVQHETTAAANLSAVATVAPKTDHENAKVAAPKPVASAVALHASTGHEDVLAMDAKVVAAAHVAAPKDLLPIGEGAYQDARAVKQRTTDSRRHCEEGKWKDCFKEGGDLLDGHEYGNYRDDGPAVHIPTGPEAVALAKQSMAARRSLSSLLIAMGLALVATQL